MKRIRRLSICFSSWILCLGLMQSGCNSLQTEEIQDQPWSARMTYSIMETCPDHGGIDFSPQPRWSYTYGLVFKAMWRVWEETEDKTILEYIDRYYDLLIEDDGTIRTYDIETYNIDMINPGKVLFALYDTTKKEKYRIAMQTLRRQMKDHPRTSVGGFWHKKRYPHQMWLDGIYMGSPFLAQYALVFDEPSLFDDVASQIILMERYSRDDNTGLLYHGWDESREQKWADPETGLSSIFWGRSMGWYAMALVDCLDYLPKNHDSYNDIVSIMDRLFTALSRFQDGKTGLWYQVVDQGDREGNYLEATCSCMYVYAMAKAVRLGYVEKSFLKVAERGYRGILENLITMDSNGHISLNQCCSVAGLGGNPYRDGSYGYYISEPVRSNDPKGTGPFILASLEMEQQ